MAGRVGDRSSGFSGTLQNIPHSGKAPSAVVGAKGHVDTASASSFVSEETEIAPGRD